MSSSVNVSNWRYYLGVSILFWAGVISAILPSPSISAAAELPQKIDVLHKAPEGKSLPTTANWMLLSVELTNTVATDLKIRLVGSRDGRFMDVVFPSGALNSADRPTYQVEIPAPAATMSYQFIIHQPDGRLVSSKRFIVERPCIQNFKVEVAGSDTDSAFRKDVSQLVAKAKILERDRANYEAALKILEELKSNIPG